MKNNPLTPAEPGTSGTNLVNAPVPQRFPMCQPGGLRCLRPPLCAVLAFAALLLTIMTVHASVPQLDSNLGQQVIDGGR